MEKEAKATCSGNACLHGMSQVIHTSLAYIATQVDLRLAMFLDMPHFTSSRSALCFPLHQYSADWTLFPTQKCSIYLSQWYRRTQRGQQSVGLVESLWWSHSCFIALILAVKCFPLDLHLTASPVWRVLLALSKLSKGNWTACLTTLWPMGGSRGVGLVCQLESFLRHFFNFY